MLKKVLSLVFFIGVGFSLSSTCSFGNEISWSGTWNTSFKKLIITQNVNNVTGTYGYDNGKITGRVNGNVLEGTWYESGNQTGKFRYVMSSDGKSFAGKWGYNANAPKSVWNGTRITPVSVVTTKPYVNGNSWAGIWNTSFKKMVIVQNGDRVTGTYVHDNGKITGTVSGKVLEGTWYESGNQSGKFRFVMSTDGKTFSGKWGNNSRSLNSSWNGTRLTTVGSESNSESVIKGNSEFRNIAWTGTWDTTFKKMILSQTGSYEEGYKQVSGTYGHDNGRLSGTVEGYVLSGTWHESGNQSGKFRFVMSTDGKTFSGKWGYNSGKLNKDWQGKRVK